MRDDRYWSEYGSMPLSRPMPATLGVVKGGEIGKGI